MNNKKFIDRIKSVEHRFDVETLRFKKMHLWPIMRCALFYYTVRQPVVVTRKSIFQKVVFLIQQRWLHTFYSFKDGKRLWLLKQSDVLFFGNNLTKTDFNGESFDYLMQPLIEKRQNAGETCLFVERGISTKFPRSMPSFQSRIFEEISMVLTWFLFPIYKQYINSSNQIGEIIDAFASEGQNKKIKNKAIKYIINVYLLSVFYKWLLVLTKPKKAYMTGYSTRTGLAICHACHQRQVQSVEVQHGNIFNNFSYVAWMKSPEVGYSTLPDEFWLWGQHDVALFKENNSANFLKGCHYSRQGIPWGQYWINSHNQGEANQYCESLLNYASSFQHKVLVTLRPSLFYKNEWQAITKIIKETKDSIFWFIRRHPTMLDRACHDKSLMEIASLNQENVNHEQASLYPLYSLLKVVDYHVTTSSNVVAEAVEFGVPTILISKLAEQEMPYLINHDLNKVILDYEELKKFFSNINISEDN